MGNVVLGFSKFKKYVSFFHDGSLLDVNQTDNKIDLNLESAELRPEWNFDRIPLSKNNTLKGILHLEGVTQISENGIHIKQFRKLYETNDISSMRIYHNKLIVLILWIVQEGLRWKYSDLYTYDFSIKSFYWENIPNL